MLFLNTFIRIDDDMSLQMEEGDRDEPAQVMQVKSLYNVTNQASIGEDVIYVIHQKFDKNTLYLDCHLK